MTLVHTSFYKITSIFFLISIASHIFVTCFYLLQKKNADHCLLASSLPFHSCWQTSLRPSSARCYQLPSWIAGRGVRSFRGYFPLSGPSQKPLHSTESLQGPCRKGLPDLEVSSVPPGGPLLQLLYRETGECSKSRPCNAGCLVHGEGNSKIKTHPMSCCTWSHVLCRCLQERCKMIWRPPTLFACDPFSKDALHVAAGLGVLKTFPFLVLVTSRFC